MNLIIHFVSLVYKFLHGIFPYFKMFSTILMFYIQFSIYVYGHVCVAVIYRKKQKHLRPWTIRLIEWNARMIKKTDQKSTKSTTFLVNIYIINSTYIYIQFSIPLPKFDQILHYIYRIQHLIWMMSLVDVVYWWRVDKYSVTVVQHRILSVST